MRRLALALLLLAAPARADEVRVFAAASLQGALDAVVARWEEETGHRATIAYAGTPQLARQIAEGAPADLFLSASEAWMDDLDDQGLLVPGTRRDLLGNRLVLVAHGESEPIPLDAATDLAGLLGDGRLAVALVDSVPAGIHAREALTALGLWPDAEPRLAQADNVRAALALVASGEAPLGIVYASDAVAAQRAGEDVSVVDLFDASLHAPIRVVGALVADTPAARDLLDALDSPEARPVWRRSGFEAPP